MDKEKKVKEVELTDNQFSKLAELYNQMSEHQRRFNELNKIITDMTSLILETKGIEMNGQRFNLDFENKKLILNNNHA